MYKVFTCPSDGCPAYTKYVHDDYNEDHNITKSWKDLSNAYNCKISITAEPSLNGKIVVEATKLTDASTYVYLQPNNRKRDGKDTHGIVENNMVYP